MPGDFNFWEGFMGVKNDFLRIGRFNLGNGSQVRFWKDTWLGSRTLKEQYPSLYGIIRKKSATVKEILSSHPLNVVFRRSLVGNLMAWHNLVARIMDVELTRTFNWFLHQ